MDLVQYGDVHVVARGSVAERLAALTVRRKCNQHSCAAVASVCQDDDHRRDALFFLPEILGMLGLPGACPAVTNEERDMWLDDPEGFASPDPRCFDTKSARA